MSETDGIVARRFAACLFAASRRCSSLRRLKPMPDARRYSLEVNRSEIAVNIAKLPELLSK
jgi:hypothetical protein